MTEARREIDPAQISPSNGRKEGRGFWHPFSSNRTYLAPAEHVITQVAKEADKNRPHKNSMPQRILYLVKKHPFEIPMILAGTGLASYAIYEEAPSLFKDNNNNPPSSTDIDSVGPTSFNDTRLQDLPPQSEQPKPANPVKVVDNRPTIPTSVPAETKKVNPKEIFDNVKDDLRISPTNSIQMSVEEYLKIAPPTIEKDSVNIPITIVSKDGQIRTLHIKRGAGMLGGERRICEAGKVCTGDNIKETLFTKNTIIVSDVRKGDVFKSPINGIIHHSSANENPDGTIERAGYFMDGHDENGNKIHLLISTVGIKQIMQTPNDDDYTEKVQTTFKRPDGTEFTTNSYRIANEKIPEVKANIGDDLFEILTNSEHNFFPGQIKIEVSTGVTENGVYRGGGARINIPTLDDKAIVLK